MRTARKRKSNKSDRIEKTLAHILFLDIKGYSSLRDDNLKSLAEYAFPEMQIIVKRRSHHYINTWGDAIVVASSDIREISHIALDIRDFFFNFDWEKYGLPSLRARISLHTGSIWMGPDVFSSRGMILGNAVNLAARIEPITHPGQIWATTDFVTLLDREHQSLFKWASLGPQTLPKNAGSEDVHVIYRAHEQSPLARGKEASVTIVVKERQVLIVKCASASGPTWQFPAGQIKPNSIAKDIAAQEVFKETDVRCEILSKIAERIHPNTGVYCHYFHAIWKSGDATNKDEHENEAVEWVSPTEALRRFTTDVEPAVRDLLVAVEQSE